MKRILFATLVLMAQNVLGANMRFLENSVWVEFSQAEIVEFKQFVGSHLDTVADGEVLVWESGESRRQGKFKVKFTHSAEGITCRRTAFGFTGETKKRELYKFDVCRQEGKWQVMETPASVFTKEDWQLLHAKGLQALNLDESGEPLSWFNQKTQNSGVFVPLSPFTKSGERCRDLAISIFTSDGKSSSGRYTFCKQGNGDWHRDFGANQEF